MARIIVGSWMARYPMGGNLSWGLQHLLGLKDLGHEVFLVEKYVYDNSCFHPLKQEMSNDCHYGIKKVSELLKQFDLENNWCFVEKGNVYHGLSKKQVEDIFATADLYIDSGANHAWSEESQKTLVSVLIDGDPAFTQMKYMDLLEQGFSLPVYDHYFTNGKNVGMPGNMIPTAGINWKPFYSPVKTDLFQPIPAIHNASFTTVMNWQSYENTIFKYRSYGHKDKEFMKFLGLPLRVDCPMEISVAGKDIPLDELETNRWIIKDAHKITISFESFRNYIHRSRGEFSVCKNGYVVTDSGWFSDKSAAYLAAGRPVVLQETGFSKHLPTGEGLFSFTTVEEAKDAIDKVNLNYKYHSKKAVEIAKEFLEARVCFKTLLSQVGL